MWPYSLTEAKMSLNASEPDCHFIIFLEFRIILGGEFNQLFALMHSA
jgi:hypothetical protein